MSSRKPVVSQAVPGAGTVSPDEVTRVVADACPAGQYHNKRVVLIVPDGTRTAPVGAMFKALYARIGAETAALDVLIALGTHQPMSDAAICERLEISPTEWRTTYSKVRFFNHEWNNPAALQNIGTIPAAD